MTQEEFKTYSSVLQNESVTPWYLLPTVVKRLLQSVPFPGIQIMTEEGEWRSRVITEFLPGRAYRMDPEWAGPEPEAKPEPKFIEDGEGDYVVIAPTGHTLLLSDMVVGSRGCIGFIYDGKPERVLRYEPISDEGQKRIGYLPVVPEAVRFLKQ
jgi:hypothetical protein